MLNDRLKSRLIDAARPDGARNRLAWLSLLAPIGLILPAWGLLGDDLGYFLAWWFVLTLLGWIAWPLATRLFPGGDAGYLLAKPLGLAGGAFLLWTMSYLQILPFRRWAAVLVLAGLAGLIWIWKAGWRQVVPVLQATATSRKAAIGECLFGTSLLLWTFARGLKPELDSLEKFMDLGFMNSLWRTDYLPALDMWLSGGKINYYYFGQYLYTYVARLAGIRPEISYNLGMASTFAMTFCLGYAAVHALLTFARRRDKLLPEATPGVGAILGGLLLAFGGNGQSFLYDAGSPGHPLLLWLSRLGLTGASNPDQTYWFADATRFIGYNPETADKTIHEFPYYSFLVADLHAHVINLMAVLLLLVLLVRLVSHAGLQQAASALRVYQRQPEPANDALWHREALGQAWSRFKGTVFNGPLLLIVLLLGLSMMGNYWDFAIYTALTAFVLLLVNSRGYGLVFRPAGLVVFAVQMMFILIPYLLIGKPAAALLGFAAAVCISNYLTLVRGDALTLTGAQLSWIFFLAHLLTLPFNLSFESISKSIALAVNHTPLWQLLVLWGPHLLAGLLLAVGLAVGRRRGRFLQSINMADLLALAFFVYAAGLILVPELVYVVDIYGGEYKRANTMFKFTYQAFVLLTLVWAYAAARISGVWAGELLHSQSAAPAAQAAHGPAVPIGRKVCGVLLVLGLIFPAWYPFVATPQWLGSFSADRYQGLDGLQLFAEKDSVQNPEQAAGDLAPDVAAIRWLNDNVSGQPVILESFGESYTDYCRIAAFTGLPTVLGWETHEWLWRTSKATPNAYGSVVLPRQQDIRTLYTTTDQLARQDLLKKYHVAYVIIGDLERARFSETLEDGSQHSLVQQDLLLQMGSIAFQAGDLLVIRLN